jgi:5-methylcytosine-specific restriction endonuclease McrA
MKAYARDFYNSTAWKKCRAAYTKKVGGLCEICLSRGEYRPGEIVHHKVPITPENINDPTVVLSWDNLQLVCRECHAAEHEKRKRRYTIDALGRVRPPLSK